MVHIKKKKSLKECSRPHCKGRGRGVGPGLKSPNFSCNGRKDDCDWEGDKKGGRRERGVSTWLNLPLGKREAVGRGKHYPIPFPTSSGFYSVL